MLGFARTDQVCLSIYYLLLVHFGLTQDEIAKYAEPFMHSAAILVGFGTGFASLGQGLFTRTTLWCWITPYPEKLRVFLFYVPLWSSMIFVLGINIWIYTTVRKREKEAEKLHAIHHEKHGRPSLGEVQAKAKPTSMRLAPEVAADLSTRISLSTRRSLTSEPISEPKSRVSFTFGHDPSNIFLDSCSTQDNKSKKDALSVPNLDRIDESSATENGTERGEENESKAMDEPSLMPATDGDNEQGAVKGEGNTFFTSLGSISTMVLPERSAKRFSRKLSKRRSSITAGNAQASFVLAEIEDYPSAARQYAATYQIGARLILYQSMAYVLGFWTIWIFSTADEIVILASGQQLFWIFLLRAIFEPLQGIFAFSVYRFAHLLRLKELYPNWSTGKLIRHTIRWTFLTKRSNFEKAKRESIERSNRTARSSSWFINSDRVREDGEHHSDDAAEPDSDSDSSAMFVETQKEADIDGSDSRVLYRMSSLLGDLMTEFTDYPDTLNEEYKEVVGENLFSYPVSSFPTVYEGQSFSATPSSFPDVVPMAHFPVDPSKMQEELSANTGPVEEGVDTQKV